MCLDCIQSKLLFHTTLQEGQHLKFGLSSAMIFQNVDLQAFIGRSPVHPNPNYNSHALKPVTVKQSGTPAHGT